MPREPALRNSCHGPGTSLPQSTFHPTDHVQQDISPTNNQPPSALKSGAGEARLRGGRRRGWLTSSARQSLRALAMQSSAPAQSPWDIALGAGISQGRDVPRDVPHACEPCPANTFKDDTSNAACSQCPAHTSVRCVPRTRSRMTEAMKPERGDEDCTRCPPFSLSFAYNQTSIMSCLCEQGYIRNVATKLCDPCPAGSFNNRVNASA
jgi:hypothetical protein